MSPRSPPDWDLGEAPQFAPPRLGAPSSGCQSGGRTPPDRNLGENCVVEVGNPSQSGGRTPRSQSVGELCGRSGEPIPIWGTHPQIAIWGRTGWSNWGMHPNLGDPQECFFWRGIWYHGVEVCKYQLPTKRRQRLGSIHSDHTTQKLLLGVFYGLQCSKGVWGTKKKRRYTFREQNWTFRSNLNPNCHFKNECRRLF